MAIALGTVMGLFLPQELAWMNSRLPNCLAVPLLLLMAAQPNYAQSSNTVGRLPKPLWAKSFDMCRKGRHIEVGTTGYFISGDTFVVVFPRGVVFPGLRGIRLEGIESNRPQCFEIHFVDARTGKVQEKRSWKPDPFPTFVHVNPDRTVLVLQNNVLTRFDSEFRPLQTRRWDAPPISVHAQAGWAPLLVRHDGSPIHVELLDPSTLQILDSWPEPEPKFGRLEYSVGQNHVILSRWSEILLRRISGDWTTYQHGRSPSCISPRLLDEDKVLLVCEAERFASEVRVVSTSGEILLRAASNQGDKVWESYGWGPQLTTGGSRFLAQVIEERDKFNWLKIPMLLTDESWRRLATSLKRVEVYDAQQGKLVLSFPGNQVPSHGRIHLSPDGKLLAIFGGTAQGFRVYELPD